MAAPKMADVVGWYDISWKGGSFPICFRPAGKFFCPKFQAAAKWSLEGDVIKLDWAKYGKYEFKFDAATHTMQGNAMPKSDAENNWRKCANFKPLGEVELALIGDGAGSEWDFEWKDGKFPVQFKADGYNHFKCDEFPAHAHWSLDGHTLKIDWAEYGKYEMKVNAAEQSMEGHAAGQPEDWRKAKRQRTLLDNKVIEEFEHLHD